MADMKLVISPPNTINIMKEAIFICNTNVVLCVR